MLISELAERSGVPVPTVKFYLREGVLPRGEATSATRAEYTDEHVARLRLIAALADVGGLPLARIREVLALIDEPLEDPVATMGRAVGALPPYVDDDGDHSRARAAIDALGLTYEPAFAAVAQLESAIRAVEAAGLPWGEEQIRRYGTSMRAIAVEEIAPMSAMDATESLSYAVLGTTLYEPVMLALRRLAHHHELVARPR